MINFDHFRSDRRGSDRKGVALPFRMAVRLSAALVVCLIATLGLALVPANSQAAGKTPVIVIPGIAGSTFTTGPGYTFSEPDNGHGGSYSHTYDSNENVWVNVWEAALPGSDDYFDTMRLNYDGNTPTVPYSLLHVSGVYDSAYSDIVDFLHRQGYVDNVTLFTYAYDWRRDIPSATYNDLDALVNRARAAAGTSQVDLVGHSMGGLVARNYISASSAAAAKVRRLITLGTPYLGSPKFLKTLLYGDQFGPSFLGLGLDPGEIQDLVQNMAGGWELLPTAAYYNFYNNSNGNLLSPYREDRDVDGNGVAQGVLSFGQLSTFLRNLGKNQNAAAFALNLHNRLDNAWPTSHPVLSFIDGSGISTLGQVRDYTGSCWSWFHYVSCPKTDLLNVDGDGTVPFYSSTLYDGSRGFNLSGGASIHIVNREHGALVQYDTLLGIRTGDGPSLTVLGQILNNQVDPITGGVASPISPNLAGTRVSGQKLGLTGYSILATNGTRIEAFDAQGRHTGLIAGQTDKYEQNIPGSRLDSAGDSQVIYLPDGNTYQLRFTAGSAGSFDVKVRSQVADTIKQTVTYLNVPASAGQQVELNVSSTLSAKAAGLRFVGGQQAVVAPTATLDEQASLDREGPQVSLNVTPSARSSKPASVVSWQASDNLAGLYLQQGLVDPGTSGERAVQNGQPVQLTPGVHTLQVIAVDRAGNSTVKQVQFTVA